MKKKIMSFMLGLALVTGTVTIVLIPAAAQDTPPKKSSKIRSKTTAKTDSKAKSTGKTNGTTTDKAKTADKGSKDKSKTN